MITTIRLAFFGMLIAAGATLARSHAHPLPQATPVPTPSNYAATLRYMRCVRSQFIGWNTNRLTTEEYRALAQACSNER